MKTLTQWIEDNEGPSELASAITSNLTAWRQQSTFPPLPENRLLRAAVLHQDSIGWRSYLDGFISVKWKIVIEQHFVLNHSKKSAELWLSKLVRQIWNLQWELWMDRNETLHGEGNTIHLEEITAINEELIKQWMEGVSDLPRTRYQHLFSGEFRTLYQKDHHQKRQWLTSVWLAREKYSNTPVTRNQIADNFFQRWQRRIAYPPEDPVQEAPHTTEPPSATLPCEAPPELDLPPVGNNLHGRQSIHESPSATLPSDTSPELEPPPAEPPPD